MIRIRNSEFIKQYENELTISKIGKIDITAIKDETYYSLYYKFPLIERLIIEIYKSVPGTNIEKYEQGTMKTINSIIKNNNSFELLPSDLIEKIDFYFHEGDDSPRNIVFHEFGAKEKKVAVNWEEINYIIANLLLLLNHVSKEYNLSTLSKIKPLKNCKICSAIIKQKTIK